MPGASAAHINALKVHIQKVKASEHGGFNLSAAELAHSEGALHCSAEGGGKGKGALIPYFNALGVELFYQPVPGQGQGALGIDHLADKPAHRLSGGETARMALCRLMMKEYELVILDEPTAAMDMETTSLSENLIRQYVQESGCALILVTHSLQQARRLADEVMYFHQGRLLEYGPAQSLLFSPQKTETKQFLDFYGA